MSRVRASAALAALALAGCVRLLPEPPPPPRIYQLRAETAASVAAAPFSGVIGVARPNAPSAVSGVDLVWVRDGRVGYLERSVWASRMPDALQTLLVETIDAQDLALAGIRVGEGPRADYDVRWDVQAFEVSETADALAARFVVEAKLVRSADRTLVAAQAFRFETPLPSRSESAAVAALQQVAAAGTSAIAAWAAAAAVASTQSGVDQEISAGDQGR